VRYGLHLHVLYMNPSKPGGHYVYHQFTRNIQQFYVLRFVCFVWIWGQTAIISLYSINWLILIIDTECLLRGTEWIILYNLG